MQVNSPLSLPQLTTLNHILLFEAAYHQILAAPQKVKWKRLVEL